jgi:hypothetical protein
MSMLYTEYVPHCRESRNRRGFFESAARLISLALSVIGVSMQASVAYDSWFFRLWLFMRSHTILVIWRERVRI